MARLMDVRLPYFRSFIRATARLIALPYGAEAMRELEVAVINMATVFTLSKYGKAIVARSWANAVSEYGRCIDMFLNNLVKDVKAGTVTGKLVESALLTINQDPNVAVNAIRSQLLSILDVSSIDSLFASTLTSRITDLMNMNQSRQWYEVRNTIWRGLVQCLTRSLINATSEVMRYSISPVSIPEAEEEEKEATELEEELETLGRGSGGAEAGSEGGGGDEELG